jgi:hypothetical protein
VNEIFICDFTERQTAIQIGIAFIDAIMEPYEDIPNSLGMKVLRDVPGFEGKNSKNVVIRSITEDFWNKVIKATESINKDTRVCAVGTPNSIRSMS